MNKMYFLVYFFRTAWYIKIYIKFLPSYLKKEKITYSVAVNLGD